MVPERGGPGVGLPRMVRIIILGDEIDFCTPSESMLVEMGV